MTPAPRSSKMRVYEHLKRQISSSPASSSYFLSENETAAELGVSRTPVREALAMLEVEGLVEIVPKKGAFVPEVSDIEQIEIMETRAMIETFCAGRAAGVLSGDVRALRAAVDVQQTHVHDGAIGDVASFMDADLEFHRAIIRSASHRTMAVLYRAMEERQLRLGLAALLSADGRAQQVLDEHRQIVDAIEARDMQRIRAAVIAHIDCTLQTLPIRPDLRGRAVLEAPALA